MQKFGAAEKADEIGKYSRLKTTRKDFGFWHSDSSVSFAFRLTLLTVYTNDLLQTPDRPLSALLCPEMPLAVVPLVSDNQKAEHVLCWNLF